MSENAMTLVDSLIEIEKYTDMIYKSIGPQEAGKFEKDVISLKRVLSEQPTTVESSAVQRSPIKPVVDPDLDANQRLVFKLGWKSAEEAHKIK
jgi:hypothetical protein